MQIFQKRFSKLLPGFTLVELLIVIAILSILSTLGLANFQSSRIKARDISRKSDLQTIAKSLEAYVNDHRTYPLSNSEGEIVCKSNTPTECPWGEAFTDDNGTIYAARLPADSSGFTYWYSSLDGTEYRLYAHLENSNDNAIIGGLTQTCGGTSVACNYQVSSSNIQ